MSKKEQTSDNRQTGNSSLGVVMRCFILFSTKNQLTEYHGIVVNSKYDAERIAKSLSKSLKKFVDYREETRILNNTQLRDKLNKQ